MLNTVKPVLFYLLLLLSLAVSAEPHDDNAEVDVFAFDDSQLEEELVYPDWFKINLGDLRDDITEAREAGKTGIIVYFGQKRCAYCEQFLEVNLGSEDIQHYLRKHFDIIPIDIWNIDDIIDADGKEYTERGLSIHYGTNFTPSLVFYDIKGKPVFRLRGYYSPYKFRAALKYVVEQFYKEENFRDYLERAEPGTFFLTGGLNERDFFLEAPYDLKKTLQETGRPLAVFFEQGECHACDLLHTGPLNEEEALKEIEQINAIQLDMWADTPVITPSGDKTTAKDWAKKLELFYTPTIIFFDPEGEEIIRVDSVVQYYRLWGVLNYVNRKGYLSHENYQTWRLKQRETK